MRDTSLLAYVQISESGLLNTFQAIVYDCIINNPDITDKEISRYTQLEINIVTGRRNELVKRGLVEDNGKRTCKITKRKAYIWRTV